jgi:hypothetical protein
LTEPISTKIFVSQIKKKNHFQEKVSAFNLKDFEKMAGISGLNIVKIFGDYQLNKFEKEHSDRLILLLEKN